MEDSLTLSTGTLGGVSEYSKAAKLYVNRQFTEAYAVLCPLIKTAGGNQQTKIWQLYLATLAKEPGLDASESLWEAAAASFGSLVSIPGNVATGIASALATRSSSLGGLASTIKQYVASCSDAATVRRLTDIYVFDILGKQQEDWAAAEELLSSSSIYAADRPEVVAKLHALKSQVDERRKIEAKKPAQARQVSTSLSPEIIDGSGAEEFASELAGGGAGRSPAHEARSRRSLLIAYWKDYLHKTLAGSRDVVSLLLLLIGLVSVLSVRRGRAVARQVLAVGWSKLKQTVGMGMKVSHV